MGPRDGEIRGMRHTASVDAGTNLTAEGSRCENLGLVVQRVAVVVLSLGLMVVSTGTTMATTQPGDIQETRFHTGCEPGPAEPPPWPDPLVAHPLSSEPAEPVTLLVDLTATPADKPILGSGFNMENALWSCPEFRSHFRSEVLDPFQPSIVRLDSGLLPAAPDYMSASDLGPAVYESMLSSAPYVDSWNFFRRLNRAGVKIVLGIWGGPSQFTDDGTRRGLLLPRYYDAYADYVATVAHYLVRNQRIQLWATTIANEPDGGDGNQIPPEGLAYIAHQLAPRLAEDNVNLYGPDTADGADALTYLVPMLNDPVVRDELAFVGFHQYFPSDDVGSVVDLVHSYKPDLPVIVTEYTSFSFGDLDAGQEAHNQYGFTLDIATTLLSHYRQGADAALYWDAVDYLQPGHTAITRWGILEGPAEDFQKRVRYYGLLQILPYLQPGSVVLADQQYGGDGLHTLEVRTPSGQPAVILVNDEFGEVDLSLDLMGASSQRFDDWAVTRTARGHLAETVGRLKLEGDEGELTLPPRSITTLFPAGAAAVQPEP